MYCHKCGFKMSDGDVFCGSCGCRALPSDVQQYAQVQPPKPMPTPPPTPTPTPTPVPVPTPTPPPLPPQDRSISNPPTQTTTSDTGASSTGPRVPIVGTIVANSPEIPPFPAVNSQSRIVYEHPDGESCVTMFVDKLACMDKNAPDPRTGQLYDATCFQFKEPGGGSWEITCTAQRVTFWNSVTVNHDPTRTSMYPGKKGKRIEGVCTAGHLYYKNLGSITTGFMEDFSPFLVLSCVRTDGTRASVFMLVNKVKMDMMRGFAFALYERVTAYLRSNELTDDSVREDYVEKWYNGFTNGIWTHRDTENRFIVPTKGFLTVPINRVR